MIRAAEKPFDGDFVAGTNLLSSTSDGQLDAASRSVTRPVLIRGREIDADHVSRS
jgi:hypothetical protein